MLITKYSHSMSETLECQCAVCKEPSKQKCSNCKIVYYCSPEHQQSHWKDHKEECKPFEIGYSKELGRYLIAKRDLEPGDIIFADKPLVFGPRPQKFEDGPFPCVGCGKLLLDEVCQCLECGWPACSPECAGLKSLQAHGCECQILKLRQLKADESYSYEYFRFDILIILRALFLQKLNKKKWDVLVNLEDHLELRGPNTDIFKVVQEKVNHIQEHYLKPLQTLEQETGQIILPQVSSDMIHKLYATLDVNATELTESVDMFILYPTASLLEHNCVPNTCQSIDQENEFKATYRAALPIMKGEHITTSYTNILWSTQERRNHLKENKYFSCTCKRCSDPTELGTFLSALICLGTQEEPCKGIQLPLKPIANNPSWVCNKCGLKLPNKEITSFVEHLSKEVEKEMEKKPKMEELEEFVNKLEVFLHPNHYLVYTVKHSLVQLYQTDGEVEISNQFLMDKLKLCQNLIELTKKIDPGNSRLALYLAVLLNELYLGKFKQLNRSFSVDDKGLSNGLIKDLLDILNDIKKVLENERQSDAGSKLLNVATMHELKFMNWLEENSVII